MLDAAAARADVRAAGLARESLIVERLETVLGERAPDAPWVVVGRSGFVYHLVGHASREGALAECAEWNFESTAVIDVVGDRFYSVKSAASPTPLNSAWFTVWLQLSPELAERAMFELRMGQPRRWEINDLLAGV